MNWMNLQTLLAALLLLPMLLLPGAVLLTPRLTRPDIFFSFTVDPSLRPSDTGRAILRQFRYAVLLSTLFGLALTLSGVLAGLTPALAVGLILGGGAVEFAGMLTAYKMVRRRVRPYQAEPSREREAVLRPRPARPVGGWLGQAGPFLILGVAALCTWWRWDAIPQRFAIHGDLHGRADGWAMKSWHSVFGPVLVGTLCCLFLGLFMNAFARGVRRVHSSGLDGEKESRFFKTMLWMLLGVEYGMAAMFAGFSPIMPPGLNIIPLVALSLLGLAAVVVVIRSGQGGWRLRGPSSASTPGHQAPAGDRTPDECWKGGLFYYNPADPAVFVEKRFGVGWTFNLGNPRAWLGLGATLLFGAAVVWLAMLLMGN
jgi:uncharacterized membrane protein